MASGIGPDPVRLGEICGALAEVGAEIVHLNSGGDDVPIVRIPGHPVIEVHEIRDSDVPNTARVLAGAYLLEFGDRTGGVIAFGTTGQVTEVIEALVQHLTSRTPPQ